MPPGQGRLLHPAQRTDPRHTPATQFRCQLLSLVLARRQTHCRDLAANRFRGTKRLGEVSHRLDVNKPVSTRKLELRIGFVHHS